MGFIASAASVRAVFSSADARVAQLRMAGWSVWFSSDSCPCSGELIESGK